MLSLAPPMANSLDSRAELASRYAGKRCLVTGGLGFIGSNLTLALADAGAKVSVVDSLEPRHGGDRRNIEGAPVDVVIGDIGDPGAVAEPLSEAEYVFNLAGQVSHLDSMTDPLHDLDINARSQLAFLEELRRARPEARVVYASTRQVYGRPQSLPVDETHPLDPVDVNGVSKLAADRLHRLYHRVHGIAASVLRLSNVYGPRQRLDGDHQGFLPAFGRRAIEGEAITVFGDGSQQRDCIYVDDALRALLTAAGSPQASGEVFNIGHHEHLSLLEIADAVVAAAGNGEVVTAPWPEDRERIAIDSYWTDYRKAQRRLGWEPTTSLAEGLTETLAHHRSRLAWQA
jgi:UDP-glucose 4-epimerase